MTTLTARLTAVILAQAVSSHREPIRRSVMMEINAWLEDSVRVVSVLAHPRIAQALIHVRTRLLVLGPFIDSYPLLGKSTSCNPLTGCASVDNTAPCTSVDGCTVDGTCRNGACTGTFLCGCLGKNDLTPCSDGNACTIGMGQPLPAFAFNICRLTGDYCRNQTCVAGNGTLACSTSNPCLSARCDTTLGCVISPNDTASCATTACVVNGMCAAGVCVGQPRVCGAGDTNPCHTWTCEEPLGCRVVNNTDACDGKSSIVHNTSQTKLLSCSLL